MDRRLKVVAVDQELVGNMVRRGFLALFPCDGVISVENGIPDDARLERVDFNSERLCFILAFSHHSWEVVPQGEYPPVITPKYRVELSVDRVPRWRTP
jgi:hypothetical protein